MSKENQNNETTSEGVEKLVNRYYTFLDNLDPKKRVTYGILWGIIAAVLVTVASLPIPEGLKWVSGIAGAPGGIIVFLFLLAIIHLTKLRDTGFGKIREERTARQRMIVAVGIVIATAISLIAIGQDIIPFGVGGTVIIVAILGALNIMRRTPQEIEWAKQGIPDPRELEGYNSDTDSNDDQYDNTENWEDEDTDDDLPQTRTGKPRR